MLDLYSKTGYSSWQSVTAVVGEDGIMQLRMFDEVRAISIAPFRSQLLKWIGNKQRFAHEIVAYFPPTFGAYYEPFLGSGGVLGTLAPQRAIASDTFSPLMEIWQTLHDEPENLKQWYAERWHKMIEGDKTRVYEHIRSTYNDHPNGADLLFLCRSCYGGVVRFRQADGYMSTPCGIHAPIPPTSFDARVDTWHKRTQGTEFLCTDYEQVMDTAASGDMIYCDPPYLHSQSILYGAQAFELERLFTVIDRCRMRGVRVALSIDGTKRSGNSTCEIPLPAGLFKHELFVNIGRSMLKRFQMNGQTLEGEVVADRLLLTY